METTMRICKVCGRELPAEQFTDVCKECHSQKIKEGVEKRKRLKQQAADAKNARNLRLQDFSPRELMARLKELGYVGKLEYVEKHVIDLNNL